ncbi:MAG: rhodanese-like domain-containing protein [Planctomycetota bacterium]|nr:MAG: rhodanese-like domain-containing protein [Planctomycetota bacterium]
MVPDPSENDQTAVPLEIDVHRVAELLAAGGIVLVDCREPDEFEIARIAGAVLLPMSQWESCAGQLEQFRGQHLVVHCHHGMRSLRVARWLREHGFGTAQSMAGGIDAWSQCIDPAVPQY